MKLKNGIGFTGLTEDIVIEEFDKFLEIIGDRNKGVGERAILRRSVFALGDNNVDCKVLYTLPRASIDSQDVVELNDDYSQIRKHSGGVTLIIVVQLEER